MSENKSAKTPADDGQPVAWMHTTAAGLVYFRKKPHDKVFSPQAVYTAPPKQWVGLTDEEIAQGPQEVLSALYGRWGWAEKEAFEAVVAWAEAKLKEKTVTDRELMKWALYALEGSNAYDWPVVEELKERLEQPEQEPVAWLDPEENRSDEAFRWGQTEHHIVPLYKAPQKQWVSLTDQEVWEAIDDVLEGGGWLDVARVLEQAFKEKNQ